MAVFDVVVNVVEGVSLVVTGASVLAAVTPTPKDDGVLAKVRKVVEFLALMVGGAKRWR